MSFEHMLLVFFNVQTHRHSYKMLLLKILEFQEKLLSSFSRGLNSSIETAMVGASESACQRWRHGFDSWFGKIHMPQSTAPQLVSLHSGAREL